MRYLTQCLTLVALIAFMASCTDQIVEPDTRAVNTGQEPALDKKSGTIWRVPGDFATIQDAIDDAGVLDGDWILVGSGNHAGPWSTRKSTSRAKGGPLSTQAHCIPPV